MNKCLRYVIALWGALLISTPWLFAQDDKGAVERHVRPLRVDDLVKRVYIPDNLAMTCFATTGESIAYTVARMGAYFQEDNDSQLESDVWVQQSPNVAPVNITAPAAYRNCWQPVAWSPDGRYLALIAGVKAGGRLYVWDSRAGTLTRLTDYPAVERPEWIDSRTLFCGVRQGNGAQVPMSVNAARSWEAARDLTAPSAIVWDGVPNAYKYSHERRVRKLITVAVDGSGEREVASGDNLAQWKVSPDRSSVAIGRVMLDDQGRLSQNLVELVNLRDARRTMVLPLNKLAENSFAWRGDSKALAFFEEMDEPKKRNLWRVDCADGTFQQLALGGCRPATANLMWLGSRIVFQAKAAEGGGVSDRIDWWAGDGAVAECLSRDLKIVPPRLHAVEGGEELLGIAAGVLWSVSPSGRTTVFPVEQGDPGEIVKAWQEQDGAKRVAALIRIRGADDTWSYRRALFGGRIEDVVAPTKAARIGGYLRPENPVFYENKMDGGLVIWRMVPEGEHEIVVKVAGHEQHVAEASSIPIRYRSLDGETLGGRLMLPFGYTPGRKYPLVVWVYATSVTTGEESALTGSNFRPGWDDFRDHQLLTAVGYAVLVPSMPVRERTADDLLHRLTNGVLPAIERTIDLGVCDPNRVFVAGHSFGGYSTMGIVTQTRRFRAAVAIAGISNLVSGFESAGAEGRYQSDPEQGRTFTRQLEGYVFEMGQSPWDVLERYYRNSPVTYADSVHTPVMLVHGDMDFVPVTQSEAFFYALYRQNKRVRLVTYANEGHNFRRHANIRDIWARIYAWFDEFGDIQRDSRGNLVWDGERVACRAGTRALGPEEFMRFGQFFDQNFGRD